VSTDEQEWLNKIAACVHEDARDTRKAEFYQRMIRDWAEGLVSSTRPKSLPPRAYFKRESPHWTDEDIEAHLKLYDYEGPDGVERKGDEGEFTLNDPIAITTHAGTPMNKQYATLAAIHDASRHCHFLIDPWALPDDASKTDTRELYLGLKYEMLKRCVPELTAGDEPGLRRMLDEVAADLERRLRTGEAANENVKKRVGGREKVRRPVWERLELQRSEDGSDHTAILDGQRVPIRGDAALKMLTALQAKKGERVKGILLQKEIRRPPNQVYRLLDERLQRIIDPPGQGGTGYAMREHAPPPQGTPKKGRTSRKKSRSLRKSHPKRAHRS